MKPEVGDWIMWLTTSKERRLLEVLVRCQGVSTAWSIGGDGTKVFDESVIEIRKPFKIAAAKTEGEKS